MIPMRKVLTVALPKGKLGDDSIALLREAGYPTEGLEVNSRKLSFSYEGIKYIICRPTDVPVYVEHGAADVGIVGKDTIVEAAADVFELVDLKFGTCRFVVALPRKRWEGLEQQGQGLEALNHGRVATKFPKVADEFFRSQGMQVEVIKLHGNIELAPQVGLSEMIVDIVSTGRTLKENDLIPVQEIFTASARLIANRVSYRMRNGEIQNMAEKLKSLVEAG